MSDTPNIDIRPDHWQIVRDILRKHVPQYAVWAFGSRAKWLAKQYSDLDLAIITDQPLSLAVSAALADDFAESDLPWKVDIVDWAATSEAFRQIIKRDRVVVQKSRSGPGMVSEWRDTTWGEEISLEYGKAMRGYDEVRGKYRVFGSNGAIGWTENALAEGPGVILGRKGAYRGVRFWREPFWVIDTAYYVVPKKKLDMRWLYYAIKHHKLGEIDDGSPIPSTTRAAVYVRELTVPSLKEQGEISYVLGVLDDKIELNRRMNQTLEAMARTLFKSWFVDFDGMSPEDMQESELGLIPKGWRAGTLSDVAEHPRRSVQPGNIKANTPYLALEHMPRRCIALAEWEVADGLESNKYEFKRSEILFGKLRPYFHKVGVAPVDGVCSTDIVVIAPSSPTWFGFVLTHTSSDEFVKYTSAGSTGTKMPRTSWQEMSRYAIALPPESIAFEFNQHIQRMTEKIVSNIHESQALIQLRDTLLPKLLSGELRVKDAERIAGTA
ncbi:restriction endonuclease subunit S [Xanthomonas hortorum]|uniref:restriction endonuclease subunit S n=1 Tax=Xanthomonas hortorum TaxID=56454 RepID=UPI001F200B37|nr:restriction endonuclease subunit S [Xanthomonas hortorum]MCE4363935.1 restriction endonuclease subunit S [Xanthomonas hortorum]